MVVSGKVNKLRFSFILKYDHLWIHFERRAFQEESLNQDIQMQKYEAGLANDKEPSMAGMNMTGKQVWECGKGLK